VNPELIKKYVLGIRKVLGDQSNKPMFVANRGNELVTPPWEGRDEHGFV